MFIGSLRRPAATLAMILGLAGVSLADDPIEAARAKAEAAAVAPTTSTPDPAKIAVTPEKPAPAKGPKIETATFAEGCFWSTEAVFERVPGVKSVTSGFSGGTVAGPSYEMVCSGETGHAEVIQIQYDANVVSYDDLLRMFFKSHDPTTLNSQGADFGTQYRSAIFYHNDAQKQAAQTIYRELTAKKAFRHPIVTQLLPYTVFWPAEAYHQDYYRNHPFNEYSQYNIVPKLQKLHLAR